MDEQDVYVVWLVEGYTCFDKELSLFEIFKSRKEARLWVANNNMAHTHFKIRKGEVE